MDDFISATQYCPLKFDQTCVEKLHFGNSIPLKLDTHIYLLDHILCGPLGDDDHNDEDDNDDDDDNDDNDDDDDDVLTFILLITYFAAHSVTLLASSLINSFILAFF